VYDPAGNRTSKQNLLNGITENYSYDKLYQLTQAMQGATTTESYTYDLVGNRISSTAGQYTYNKSNQLTTLAAIVFAYDSNGSTTSKTSGTNLTTYQWDFENRLSSVTLPNGGGVVSFRYDPMGRRIQKTTSSGATEYLYDGANIVSELNVSGSVVASYMQGAGIDEPLAMKRGGYIAYYHVDGLGSTTSLSGTTGKPVATYVYDAFGNTTATEGIFNPFRYTGREQDPETGLYYYRARYYDPNIGRFVSEDPIRFFAGINFYEYGFNDPVDSTDPSGLDTLQCERPLNMWGSQHLPPHVLLYSTNAQAGAGLGPKEQFGVLWQTTGKIEWENPFDSSGNIKSGYSCQTVSKNNCVEKCVIKRLKEDSVVPPNYEVGQHQCSQYATDVMSACAAACRGQK
jgi:RHS repeat-associated protein